MDGNDLVGLAQTGTGKTAAFALPILHHLGQVNAHAPRQRTPRCLVLTPTRELAAQVGDSFRTYGRNLHLRTAVIFGGVGFGNQISALKEGVDILVACPGRLLDLIGQGHVKLGGIEVLVLDEADRMLDMGFVHDIRKVVAYCQGRRQTLLFSATMPREIRDLASFLLKDPVEVAVAAVSSAAETVDQSVFHVARGQKLPLLARILKGEGVGRALVFTRTKHGADKVAKKLDADGIRAEAIHGNKSQNARTRTLDNFKKGTVRVLVASDLASRGLDVDGITHVINFEIPNEPETYVHRIGRTGRAGASGIAIALCDGEERGFLKDIERTIRRALPVNVLPTDLPMAEILHEDRPREGGFRGGFRGGRNQAPRRNSGGGDPHRSGHPSPGNRGGRR
jgi:ATP-dependent RNA helicase RhlE